MQTVAMPESFTFLPVNTYLHNIHADNRNREDLPTSKCLNMRQPQPTHNDEQCHTQSLSTRPTPALLSANSVCSSSSSSVASSASVCSSSCSSTCSSAVRFGASTCRLPHTVVDTVSGDCDSMPSSRRLSSRVPLRRSSESSSCSSTSGQSPPFPRAFQPLTLRANSQHSRSSSNIHEQVIPIPMHMHMPTATVIAFPSSSGSSSSSASTSCQPSASSSTSSTSSPSPSSSFRRLSLSSPLASYRTFDRSQSLSASVLNKQFIAALHRERDAHSLSNRDTKDKDKENEKEDGLRTVPAQTEAPCANTDTPQVHSSLSPRPVSLPPQPPSQLQSPPRPQASPFTFPFSLPPLNTASSDSSLPELPPSALSTATTVPEFFQCKAENDNESECDPQDDNESDANPAPRLNPLKSRRLDPTRIAITAFETDSDNDSPLLEPWSLPSSPAASVPSLLSLSLRAESPLTWSYRRTHRQRRASEHSIVLRTAAQRPRPRALLHTHKAAHSHTAVSIMHIAAPPASPSALLETPAAAVPTCEPLHRNNQLVLSPPSAPLSQSQASASLQVPTPRMLGASPTRFSSLPPAHPAAASKPTSRTSSRASTPTFPLTPSQRHSQQTQLSGQPQSLPLSCQNVPLHISTPLSSLSLASVAGQSASDDPLSVQSLGATATSGTSLNSTSASSFVIPNDRILHFHFPTRSSSVTVNPQHSAHPSSPQIYPQTARSAPYSSSAISTVAPCAPSSSVYQYDGERENGVSVLHVMHTDTSSATAVSGSLAQRVRPSSRHMSVSRAQRNLTKANDTHQMDGDGANCHNSSHNGQLMDSDECIGIAKDEGHTAFGISPLSFRRASLPTNSTSSTVRCIQPHIVHTHSPRSTLSPPFLSTSSSASPFSVGHNHSNSTLLSTPSTMSLASCNSSAASSACFTASNVSSAGSPAVFSPVSASQTDVMHNTQLCSPAASPFPFAHLSVSPFRSMAKRRRSITDMDDEDVLSEASRRCTPVTDAESEVSPLNNTNANESIITTPPSANAKGFKLCVDTASDSSDIAAAEQCSNPASSSNSVWLATALPNLLSPPISPLQAKSHNHSHTQCQEASSHSSCPLLSPSARASPRRMHHSHSHSPPRSNSAGLSLLRQQISAWKSLRRQRVRVTYDQSEPANSTPPRDELHNTGSCSSSTATSLSSVGKLLEEGEDEASIWKPKNLNAISANEDDMTG